MIELLHTAADGTLPNGHKNTVGLDELRVVQAIKQPHPSPCNHHPDRLHYLLLNS
jgi:hypothetical protein